MQGHNAIKKGLDRLGLAPLMQSVRSSQRSSARSVRLPEVTDHTERTAESHMLCIVC